jgi:hypothetical protein
VDASTDAGNQRTVKGDAGHGELRPEPIEGELAVGDGGDGGAERRVDGGRRQGTATKRRSLMSLTARVFAATVLVALALACLEIVGSGKASGDSYGSTPFSWEKCLAADNNSDGGVDVVDVQRAFAHYGGGTHWYEDPLRYDPRLDIYPFRAKDGSIDIRDLQSVMGRFGLTCPQYAQAKEYWEWLGGSYSYGSGCADGGEIDPVTTVFRYAGSTQEVHDDLVSIGLGVEAGSEQSFRDNGGCPTGEISVADDDGWSPCFPQVVCASDRWHVRANVVSTGDPTGGYWASATPHRDSGDGSPADGCGHVVRDYVEVDGFSGSGFDVGKDWVWWQMVHDGGDYFEGAQYWDNRLMMSQCDDTLSGSNGWVNVIWLNSPY